MDYLTVYSGKKEEPKIEDIVKKLWKNIDLVRRG